MFPLRDTQPSYSRPVVTISLIVVNAIVFLYELTLGRSALDAFVYQHGLVPDHFSLASVFSSMFLHSGWMHIIGNMWFLWVFGDNVEDLLGHAKYLVFYLLCGVAAALGQVFSNPYSTVPMVGASGAIAGVMGAYLIKFPRARVVTLVFIFFFITTIEIPAPILLAYWFVVQLFSGLGSIARTHLTEGGGTAFFAHVAGFIAGIVLVMVLGTGGRKDRSYDRRRDYYY